MPKLQLSELLSLTKVEQILRLSEVNAELETLTAQERIAWALENLEGNPAVSSSFGIQAAVMLQLVTDAKADTPVILTDTGYLFPETYLFVDQLTERLKLNLHVFTAEESPNWQEARYGKLWEKGVEGIEQYNKLNKVQPMRRALDQLEVGIWFSGLRREQSNSRANLPVLSIQNGFFSARLAEMLKGQRVAGRCGRAVYRVEHDLGRCPDADLAVFHCPIEFGSGFDHLAPVIFCRQCPCVLFNRQQINPALRHRVTGCRNRQCAGPDTQDQWCVQCRKMVDPPGEIVRCNRIIRQVNDVWVRSLLMGLGIGRLAIACTHDLDAE